MIRISDQLNSPPRMDSSPLGSLPTELLFRIFDFLEPHEFSGFACTCRYAVTLVNKKLDNPKDKQELYSWLAGFYFDDSEALRTQLSPCKSRTARYVEKHKRSQLMLEYWEEFGTTCEGYYPLDSEHDSDLD
jgi:hypothetical protein